MTAVSAGQIILADENNDLHDRRILAQHTRSTNSTAASAAQGVMRIDGVGLKAGRRYLIRTNTFVIIPSVAGDRATARLSHTVNNTSATTASTLRAIYNTPNIDSTADGFSGQLAYWHTPAAAGEILSVILWHQRLNGTGNVHILGSPGAGIQLIIEDRGPTVADSGVNP